MRRWLIWNVVFRLQEKLKGHPTFSILEEMEAADRLSAAALDELQSTRLRSLIDYAYQHVPYVHRLMTGAGVSPGDIRTRHDLAKLPVLHKEDMRRNRMDLRSRIAGRLESSATGGSTGVPLIFDLSPRRVASQVASRQRVARWWGLSLGDPEIALWGSPVEISRQDWIRALRDRLMATRLLSAFEMSEPVMSRYLDILQQGRYRQIFAYPSAIYMLCRHAAKEGRDLTRTGIRTVFVTGEVLYPYQRELVSSVLHCTVANGYGGRESGFIAHECPQGGMHVLADSMIVELLDPAGRPVKTGEPGEVVVTDLYSHEAPFLRYATGDVAVAAPGLCRCGRPLPMLDRIEGRSNDCIRTADGRRVNSLALMYPVRDVDGIEFFQIHQQRLDRLRIDIVRNESYPADAEQRIQSAWKRLFRSEIVVTFRYLPAPPPAGRSGKFRFVTSDLDSEARDQGLSRQARAGRS